jgi:hypothetical protein
MPNWDHFADFQAPLPQDRVQRLTFHIFHGKERAPVPSLADLVNDADMGMGKPGGRFGFRAESPALVGIFGQLGRHHL